MATTMEIIIRAVDQASKVIEGVGGKAEQAFQQADKAAKKLDLASLSKNLDNFGTKAMGAGGALTVGLTVPITATGVAITKFGQDFDAAMRNVNSISGLSEKEFEKLKGQVLNLFDQPIQDAAALANGLYDIASSGFEGAEGLKVLKESAIAATAGVSDTATASKAITGVLNAYGMAADRAGDVSDILFQTVNKGVVTFSELANGIGPVIATASAAGISFEEVGAAIATMTKGGIPAAETMTSLNGLITQLLSPTDALATALNNAGYESGLALLQTEGLAGAIKFLNEASGGSADQMAILIPEIRGLRGALSLGRQEGKAFAEDMASIADASSRAGTAGKAFAEQSKSDHVKAEIAANKMKNSMIEMYESLESVRATVLTVLGGLADGAAALAKTFGKLPEPIKFVVVGFTGLLAVAGPTLMMLGGMAQGISAIIQVLPVMSGLWGGVSKAITFFASGQALATAATVAQTVATVAQTAAQWALNAAMAANPIGLIILAVAALAAGVYLLIKNWDKVKEFFSKLWDGVKQVFSAFWEWAKDLFFKYHPLGILITHWEDVKEWFANLWDGIKDLTGKAWEGIKYLFLNYTAQGLVIKHWDGISEWFAGTWDKVKAGLAAGWDAIKNLCLNYTPGGLIIKHWESIVDWFSDLWGLIKKGMAIEWGWIKNFFLNYTPQGLIIKHWEKIADWFKGIWGKVKDVTAAGWDAIKSGVKLAAEWIYDHTIGVFLRMVDGIKNAFTAIPEFFKGLFDKVAGFFKSIANAAISGINVLIKGLNKISFTAPDWVPNIGGKSIGVNIPLIPTLHTGGVFNSSSGEGLALLRDGEVVLTPEDPLAAVYRQRRAPMVGAGLSPAGAGAGGPVIYFGQGAFSGMIVSSEQELRRFADKIGPLIAERVQRGRGKRA